VVGFLGNEAVAVFRIRVGREIGSAALVADGYHARTDGWTSLAVLLGALGVWLDYPLADPIVGLLIALTILVIVWRSGRTVFARLLDGVDPKVLEEVRHAVGHVGEVKEVGEVRARGIGHRSGTACAPKSTSPWTPPSRSPAGTALLERSTAVSRTNCATSTRRWST